MAESRLYAALLNIKAVGKRTYIPEGVVFGEFDSETFIDPEGRPYPAMVVLPAAIWEAEGKRNQIAVSFKFIDQEDDTKLSEFEDVFLGMRDDGNEDQN